MGLGRAALVVAVSSAALGGCHRQSGCEAYTPVPNELIAHAGGGLPTATYADNLEALDLAARHGFHLVELDFYEEDGVLGIGHDGPGPLTVARLAQWLSAHPGIRVVTDVKTANVEGLRLLLKQVPQERLIAQIYAPEEYAGVRALGIRDIIFTAYRQPDGWQEAVRKLPLWAVTVPVERRDEAKGFPHVFVHTVNEPMAGVGLYTDCLIPQRQS